MSSMDGLMKAIENPGDLVLSVRIPAHGCHPSPVMIATLHRVHQARIPAMIATLAGISGNLRENTQSAPDGPVSGNPVHP